MLQWNLNNKNLKRIVERLLLSRDSSNRGLCYQGFDELNSYYQGQWFSQVFVKTILVSMGFCVET